MKTENRQHLTLTLIRTIGNPAPGRGGKPAREYTYDDEVPGLAFVATSTGQRSFVLCRTITDGTFIRYTLGDVTIGVDAARRAAAGWNSKIAMGINPLEEKRSKRAAVKAEREAKANAPTLGNLWTAYLTEHLEREAKPRTLTDYRRMYKRDLEAWAHRPLSEITPVELETLKARVAQRGPYAANRILELISAMFRKAGRKFGFPKAHNPAGEVERYDEKPRTRVFSYDEMVKMMASINADDNQTAADVFKMLIYTGARKSNVQAMEWNDLSRKAGAYTWTLRGEVMKNGDPLKISLTPDASAIIDRRADSNPHGSKYVFPAGRPTAEQVEEVRKLRANEKTTREIADATGLSQSSVMRAMDPAYTAKADAHFAGSSKAWARILKRAGVPHAVIHDLRRSYVVNLVEAGVSLPIVAAVVGHRSTATTERSYLAIREKTAAKAAIEGGAKIAEALKAAQEMAAAEAGKVTLATGKARGRKKAG